MKSYASVLIASVLLLTTAFAGEEPKDPEGTVRVPVVFSGGHDTNPRDRGRPVILIAGALGVTPEIFRDAFSDVKPAPPGTEPEPEQVRKNKAALMEALGKYGISNERLDTVSNYYRYVRERGELWPVQPAVAFALVKDGAVVGYRVQSGGSGYSSTPVASVPDFKDSQPHVELTFDKAFEKNGAVSAISVPAK